MAIVSHNRADGTHQAADTPPDPTERAHIFPSTERTSWTGTATSCSSATASCSGLQSVPADVPRNVGVGAMDTSRTTHHQGDATGQGGPAPRKWRSSTPIGRWFDDVASTCPAASGRRSALSRWLAWGRRRHPHPRAGHAALDAAGEHAVFEQFQNSRRTTTIIISRSHRPAAGRPYPPPHRADLGASRRTEPRGARRAGARPIRACTTKRGAHRIFTRSD